MRLFSFLQEGSRFQKIAFFFKIIIYMRLIIHILLLIDNIFIIFAIDFDSLRSILAVPIILI